MLWSVSVCLSVRQTIVLHLSKRGKRPNLPLSNPSNQRWMVPRGLKVLFYAEYLDEIPNGHPKDACGL